jgi:hypothetical protein
MSHHTRGVTKKDVGEDVTEALTPLQMCQACNEVSIELPCTGFKLNCDEECHICAVCFSKCESGRHCQPSFECPACKSSCNQWTIKYERIQSTRRAGAPEKLSSRTPPRKLNILRILTSTLTATLFDTIKAWPITQEARILWD